MLLVDPTSYADNTGMSADISSIYDISGGYVRENTTGQLGIITADTAYWKDSMLDSWSGLSYEDNVDSKKAYNDWSRTINWYDYYVNGNTGGNPVIQPLYISASSFQPPVYTNGALTYNPQYFYSQQFGDAMYIVNEKNTVSMTTSQTLNNNVSKTVYDLDNSERIADWKLTTTVNSQSDDVHSTTQTITVKLPKGLTYIPNSSYYDADKYVNNTPLQGSLTGGSRIEPQVTMNADGSSMLVYTVNNVSTDGRQHTIHYSTRIGDEGNPDNDVVNNQKFTSAVEISSTGNKTLIDRKMKNYSEYSIQINKNKTSSLSITTDKPRVEINSNVDFNANIVNRAGNYQNPFMVIKLPSNKNNNYHGNYALTGFKANNDTMNNLTDHAAFYATSNNKYADIAVNEITRNEITDSGNWIKLSYNRTTGNITIPNSIRNTALMLAYVDTNLPEGQTDSFNITIKPANNNPTDYYPVIISDGSVLSTSGITVVDRNITGKAWFDVNGDGILNGSNDKGIKGIKVKLTDANGNVIRNVLGDDLTTTTDEHGDYELKHIPSSNGKNYQVRFINTNSNLNVMRTTKPNATDKSSNYVNSMSISKLDGNGRLSYAYINVSSIPAADEMQVSSLTFNNQNNGLTGDLPFDSSVDYGFDTGQSLRNRNLNNTDRFQVKITNNAGNNSTGVMPSVINYMNGSMSKHVNMDLSSLKPGSYSYRVSNVDTKIASVKYDTNWFTVNVKVSADYDNLKRKAVITLTRFDDSTQPVSRLSWTNTFTGTPDMPGTGSNLILIIMLILSVVVMVQIAVHYHIKGRK